MAEKSKASLDPKVDALIDDQVKEVDQDKLVKRLDTDHLDLNGVSYLILEDQGQALDIDQVNDRYTPFFDKFHYIVGDISKGQLRLKGFYRNNQEKVPEEMKINQLDDYLMEDCSFAAPYFVLERQAEITNFHPYKPEMFNYRGQPSHNKDRYKHQKNKKNKRRKQQKAGGGFKKRSKSPKFKKKSRQKYHYHSSEDDYYNEVETIKDEKGQAKFKINRKQ